MTDAALEARIRSGQALFDAMGGFDVVSWDGTKKELVAATHLVTLHGTEAFCRALLNANELVYIE